MKEDPKTAGEPNELGVQGLALHYANIISSIDKMVSRSRLHSLDVSLH